MSIDKKEEITRDEAISLLFQEIDNNQDTEKTTNTIFDEYGNYVFETSLFLNKNNVYGSSEGYAYMNRFQVIDSAN